MLCVLTRICCKVVEVFGSCVVCARVVARCDQERLGSVRGGLCTRKLGGDVTFRKHRIHLKSEAGGVLVRLGNKEDAADLKTG